MRSSIGIASKRAVGFLAATAAVVGVWATSAMAAPPPGPTGPPMDCPYGLAEKMTLEQALVRYEGYFTEAQIRAGFDRRDSNDSGYFCYRIDPNDNHYPLVVFFPPDDFSGGA